MVAETRTYVQNRGLGIEAPVHGVPFGFFVCAFHKIALGTVCVDRDYLTWQFFLRTRASHPPWTYIRHGCGVKNDPGAVACADLVLSRLGRATLQEG